MFMHRCVVDCQIDNLIPDMQNNSFQGWKRKWISLVFVAYVLTTLKHQKQENHSLLLFPKVQSRSRKDQRMNCSLREDKSLSGDIPLALGNMIFSFVSACFNWSALNVSTSWINSECCRSCRTSIYYNITCITIDHLKEKKKKIKLL